MTKKNAEKVSARARQARTGEHYTTALAHVSDRVLIDFHGTTHYPGSDIRAVDGDLDPLMRDIEGAEALAQQIEFMLLESPEVRDARDLTVWLGGSGASELHPYLEKLFSANDESGAVVVEFSAAQEAGRFRKRICIGEIGGKFERLL